MLRIALFGGVRVSRGDGPALDLPLAVETLVAYLLIQRHRAHRRDALAGTFWGEHPDDRARRCLSSALWRLRRALEPAGVPKGTYLRTTAAGEVRFDTASPHWLDVEVFERAVKRALATPAPRLEAADVAELAAALHLYVGDPLEGLYDDWAVRERERLRDLFLRAQVHLMRHLVHVGDAERAIALCEEILRHEPLREEVHRELIRLYVGTGQRARAVRQLESCREVLATELGVEPLEETRALLDPIVPNGERPRRPDGGRPDRLETAVRELRRALAGVDRARERLRSALDLLDGPEAAHAARPRGGSRA